MEQRVKHEVCKQVGETQLRSIHVSKHIAAMEVRYLKSYKAESFFIKTFYLCRYDITGSKEL